MRARRLFGPAVSAAALVAGLIWAVTGLSGASQCDRRPIGNEQRAMVGSRATPSGTLAAVIANLTSDRADRIRDLFAAPASADAFVQQWQGQLPRGEVRVSLADQVDAGAEAGHVVPVEVWVAGPQDVAGLRGEARFVAMPGGPRIQDLKLAHIALKVTTWSAAAAQLPGTDARPASSPFYGRFRFAAGTRRFAVDARTGTTEEE